MGGEEDKTDDEGRRRFLKTAAGVAIALVIAGVAAVTKSLWTSVGSSSGSTQTSFPKVKVATLSGLSANTPVIFNYPLDNEPNMIVKLGQKAAGGIGPEGDIVAFSVVCQHLGCVVGYQATGTSPKCNSTYSATGPVGYCCCHASVYDLLDGAKVIGGPSPRSQPQVMLQLDSSTGDIYAVGMGPPTVFGHSTGSSDVTADLKGGNLVS